MNTAELSVSEFLPLGLDSLPRRLRLLVGAGPLEHVFLPGGADHDNGGRVSFVDLFRTGA
jgi:hypothetical protein